jgi:hypothetical protein
MYQSALSTQRKGRTVEEAHKRLTRRLRSELEEEGPDERAFVSEMLDSMVEHERRLWGQDYFVFYRVVGAKYVLYQFHTLMLSLFHGGVHSLICTPSLDDDIYPGSLEELLDMFRTKAIRSDSAPLTSNVLISVNNCLTPVDKGLGRLHSGLKHEMEASPLKYYEGYDETQTYVDEMERRMREFFGLAADVAESAVRAMFELYQLAHPGGSGHCLQICVPMAALSRFAYPCVSWGTPVTVWVDGRGKLHVFDAEGPISREGLVPLTLAEVLRRTELCELQTRILAHPNLFLTAGAFTNVFHAHPGFDERGFKTKLYTLLKPLIERVKGKRITFAKFSDV